MKKILFEIILACFLLTACKKQHNKDDNPIVTSLQKVTFNVGFSSRLTNFATNGLSINSTKPDTSLTNYIDVLYYCVFDSLGKGLHEFVQQKTDSTFGRYTDNLHPGKYTIVIVGGQAGIIVSPVSVGTDINSVWITHYSQPSPKLYFNVDAFYKKVPITVSATSSAQNVNLDRIVSKMVVNINDPIPAGAKYLALVISNAANKFNVGTGTVGLDSDGPPPAQMQEYTLTTANAGTQNFQLSTLFLYNGASSVEVFCSTSKPTNFKGGNPFSNLLYRDNPASSNYDAYSGVVYGDKTIPNVTGAANKITLLSGDLFGGTGDGGVKVSADTNWNAPITKGF
ncbi:MAG: FimB/Mfa2 family fimbrial subunit [Bacteroidetes bacterium]|nr:FimB/Mfa2 family fimbrial subunit [Bacteroidota bacterium]